MVSIEPYPRANTLSASATPTNQLHGVPYFQYDSSRVTGMIFMSSVTCYQRTARAEAEG